MTKPERAHLHASANTHSGMRGKNNEDRYAVSTHRFGLEKDIPSVLAVVCDGIGGHRAGEVAAEIAVETISKTVADSDASQPLHTLELAIQQASEAIRTQSEDNAERKGMGSTCVCAWVIGERLYTASVGDSRLYLLRDNTIQQITTDHTWIQEAIEFGALTPEQARGHPNAHVIRRYLGSKSRPEVDFRLRLNPDETDEQARDNQGTNLKAGDILLLVSDGLTDLVEPQEIQNIVKSLPREKALQSLIDLANERGGHDNITTVMLVAPANFPQAKTNTNVSKPTAVSIESAKTVAAAPKKAPRNKLLITCAIVAILLAVLSAAGVGLYLYFTQDNDTPTPTPTSESAINPPLSMETETATITAVFATQTVQPSETATQLDTSTSKGPQQATFTPWPTNTPQPTTPSETVLPPTATQTTTPTQNAP